jgi:ABC-2 type transport system ATP-binding protein
VSKSFEGDRIRLADLFSGGRRSATSREVLRRVDLDVPEGTIVGLLGANGAGKTTLLEILCTLLLPTSGEAFVHGVSVTGEPAAVRRMVGYCPCGFDTFYPRLSAMANLEFFAALNGLTGREGRERIEAACEMAGANGDRRLEFQRYSSGMKQRLVLARALVTDPRVLLLDEPARSLDVAAQRGLSRLLKERLVGGLKKSILLVTHSLAEAREVCDRIAILQDGRIQGVLSPTELTDARVNEVLDESSGGFDAAR